MKYEIGISDKLKKELMASEMSPGLDLKYSYDFPIYQNRAERDYAIAPGGTELSKFRNLVGFQDLHRSSTGLVDPLTGTTNVELVNHGQQLLAIPGASSPPYWTDPGSVTLSRGVDAVSGVPDTIPGLIDFYKDDEGDWCRFTSPEGYGESSNGKRRTQVFFDWVSGRKKVAWDLSFRMADNDDCPYTADPEYLWKMLIFQFKGAGEPMFGMNVEAVPGKPDTYNLFWVHKYSSLPGDSDTYRSAYNSTPPGDRVNSSGTTRYFEREISKGETVDIMAEAYLDERDIDETTGGKGYLNIWINGELALAYVGPTLSIKDTDGSLPNPHSWMVGCYRHESSRPPGVHELDVDDELNPAPYTRAVEFRRARLLDLG